jgi:hypothetical protein
MLGKSGGYPPDEARAAAMQVLPGIMRYDRTRPASYPNGRVSADDVYRIRFAWLTRGKVPLAGLKPPGDLLAQFRCLGVPDPM